jgi:hypothetical protein
VRGLGASSVLSYQPVDRTTTDDSLVLDIRARLALDRIVFDRSEVALARVEIQRYERRAALEREVVDLLASMERARAEARGLEPASPERTRAIVEFARARARLEALTDTPFEALFRSR